LEQYFGNSQIVQTLERIVGSGRIPQTLLFSGPEGVGKATLARRFAAKLVGYGADRIELDDLSLETNQTLITDREKWAADKRNDDPLVFASHPDVLTFAPDGPLRQITIQQMRLLKDRAQLKPHKGACRVFVIDQIDRANEQAANSLLKTLEEPPSHLIIILTARNAYDLLPTIRSRAVPFYFGRLSEEEMAVFLKQRGADNAGLRQRLAEGAPGLALSLDLETYTRRRTSMLGLLKAAAGSDSFGSWMKHSDSIALRRTEKLESYLEVLYGLIEDVLRLSSGVQTIRNDDIRKDLEGLAQRVTFEWLRAAVLRIDDLVEFARRNIQKSIALDAFAVQLRKR
jgi:DNA polymerase-3 subunit delta'